DNILRVKAGKTLTSGIILGAQSAAHALYATSTNRYAASKRVAYNNVIVSETTGNLQSALRLMGARDSALLNNVVVGALWSIFTSKSRGHGNNGWAWDPLVRNPVIKNNAVVDAVYSITHSTV